MRRGETMPTVLPQPIRDRAYSRSAHIGCMVKCPVPAQL
jgi:hypothetical protein